MEARKTDRDGEYCIKSDIERVGEEWEKNRRNPTRLQTENIVREIFIYIYFKIYHDIHFNSFVNSCMILIFFLMCVRAYMNGLVPEIRHFTNVCNNNKY